MVFDTVLWASDGRADEQRVVRCVAELCARHRSQLWIVHVVPTIVPEPASVRELHGGEERAIAWLKAGTRALRTQGVDASLQVIRGVVGSPAPAIAQIAQAVGADLIVLHPHERRRIGHLGTTATLLVTAPCPLLLLGSQTNFPGSASPERSVVRRASPSHEHTNEPRNRCLIKMPVTPLQGAADALKS